MVTTEPIKVDLPSSKPDMSTPIKVFVTKNNEYYLDTTSYPNLALLEEALLEQVDTTLYRQSIKLMADKDANWGQCVELIDMAKRHQLSIIVATEK